MDRAIALEPSNIGVLIPRAAVLLAAARNQRDPARTRELAAQAAANFETALAIRQSAFAQARPAQSRRISLRPRGKLGARRQQGQRPKRYLRRILAELPNSPYAERAAAKLADWNERRPLNCQTCH